jgi:hypothetical protein
MPYRVGRNRIVNEQIKVLAAAAKKLGVGQLYRDALLAIVKELTDRPLEFGDPDYRMVTKDGIYCHGVHQPLLVRYVVFETEQTVQIIEVKPFPGSVFFTR